MDHGQASDGATPIDNGLLSTRFRRDVRKKCPRLVMVMLPYTIVYVQSQHVFGLGASLRKREGV